MKYWEQEGRGITDFQKNEVIQYIEQIKHKKNNDVLDIFNTLPKQQIKMPNVFNDEFMNNVEDKQPIKQQNKIRSFDDIIGNSSPDLNDLVNQLQ